MVCLYFKENKTWESRNWTDPSHSYIQTNLKLETFRLLPILQRCGFAIDDNKHLQLQEMDFQSYQLEKTERGGWTDKGTVIELTNKGHTFDWDQEGRKLVELKSQWSKQRKQTASPPFLLDSQSVVGFSFNLFAASLRFACGSVRVYGKDGVVVIGDYLMGVSGKGVTATPALCFLIKFRWKPRCWWLCHVGTQTNVCMDKLEPRKPTGFITSTFFFSFGPTASHQRAHLILGLQSTRPDDPFKLSPFLNQICAI